MTFSPFKANLGSWILEEMSIERKVYSKFIWCPWTLCSTECNHPSFFWVPISPNTHTHTNTQRFFFSKEWPLFLASTGFLCDSAGKESACNVGDLGLIPSLGRSPGEVNSYPLQYSGLYSPWSRKESNTTERLSLASVLLF